MINFSFSGRNIFITVLVAIAFIVGMELGCRCHRSPKPCPQQNTRIDTVIRKVEISKPVYIPRIDTIYRPKLTYKFDTLYLALLEGVDTAAILKDYFSTVVYKDTQNIDYGKIFITDTVSQNRIMARKLSTNLNIPTITKTTVLSQPKRNILSIVVAGQYYTGFSNVAIGGGFQYKLRSDAGFGGQVLFDPAGNKIYQLQLIYPIKLKKQ